MNSSKRTGMSKLMTNEHGEQTALRWSWLEFGVRLWQRVDIDKEQGHLQCLAMSSQRGSVSIRIVSIEKMFAKRERMLHCGYEFCGESPNSHPNAS